MPTVTEQKIPYLYEGMNKNGQIVKGRILATSEQAVKTELRKQGIFAKKIRKNAPLFKREKKIESGDIALFARQLATMLQAGMPMVQAMDIVGTGHEKPAMQKLILSIKTDVESGITLNDALAKHPLYFDDLFVNLIEAGEHAGALETLLEKVATYKEKTEALKKKIKKAMFYPTAVLGVAFIVTIILLIYVIPQFENIFKDFGAELPVFTLMVINLSKFVQTYGVILGAIIGGAIYAFFYFKKRSKTMRQNIDRLLLKIPVVGPILVKAAIARFARTLSTMFSAGVPLVEALTSVAGATGNIVYENATLLVRDEVATGQRLQYCLENTGLFPNMVVQMIAVGEESGSLDSMSAKVADFYEADVDAAVDAMSSLLEPLIMAVLGIIVGGMVVAMYLPIFKMGSVV